MGHHGFYALALSVALVPEAGSGAEQRPRFRGVPCLEGPEERSPTRHGRSGERRGVSCEDIENVLEFNRGLSETEESVQQLVLADPGPPLDIDDLTARPPRAQDMARCIHERYQAEPEAGYSFAILQDGAPAASGAGGFARALWEDESPDVLMTSTRRMTVASVSKPITASR